MHQELGLQQWDSHGARPHRPESSWIDEFCAYLLGLFQGHTAICSWLGFKSTSVWLQSSWFPHQVYESESWKEMIVGSNGITEENLIRKDLQGCGQGLGKPNKGWCWVPVLATVVRHCHPWVWRGRAQLTVTDGREVRYRIEFQKSMQNNKKLKHRSSLSIVLLEQRQGLFYID